MRQGVTLERRLSLAGRKPRSSPVNIWDVNMVIAIPEDALAPNGIKPSTDTHDLSHFLQNFLEHQVYFYGYITSFKMTDKISKRTPWVNSVSIRSSLLYISHIITPFTIWMTTLSRKALMKHELWLSQHPFVTLWMMFCKETFCIDWKQHEGWRGIYFLEIIHPNIRINGQIVVASWCWAMEWYYFQVR